LDAVAVWSVFTGISIAAFFLWGYTFIGSRRVLAEVTLQRLRTDWLACPAAPIIGTVCVGMAFRWYSAAMFGAADVSEAGQLYDLNERDLPYWYTSVDMVLPLIMFGAGLTAWGKAMVSRGLPQFFWLVLAAASAVFFFGAGRRSLIAFLVVILWSILTGASSRWRRLAPALLLCAVPVLIGLSNMYQAYRFFAYRGVPIASVMTTDTLFDVMRGAVELENTLDNLRGREAPWRFNYDVLKAHTEGRALQWGALLLNALPNHIPFAIYPGKVVSEPEAEMQRAFGFDEEVDRGANIFVFTFADFGYVGFFVAPAMIILLVWACGWIMRRLKDPFLRVILLSGALYYALNLEAQYTLPIQLARNYLILSAAYVALRTTWHKVDRLFHGQFHMSRMH
jgi:hypothetical protein